LIKDGASHCAFTKLTVKNDHRIDLPSTDSELHTSKNYPSKFVAVCDIYHYTQQFLGFFW